MQFRRSGEDTVEIVLSQGELCALKLHPDTMDCDDPITRRILAGLLQKAAKETGLCLEAGEFLVETDRCLEKTVLTITRKKEREASERLQVCRFDGCEEMLSCCIQLAKSGRCRNEDSSLYVWEDRYYLIVCPRQEQSDKVKALLLEYGHCALYGAQAAGVLREHASCLIADSALKTVERYFSRQS